jgi:polygalacturonase
MVKARMVESLNPSSFVRDSRTGYSIGTADTLLDAHDLTDSTISGLNIKNTPVQAVSVDGANNLKIESVTIDDSAGDTEGGHNTDCFDIGDSTGVYFSDIVCKNQDDCIAINSGTDIQFTGGTCSGGHGLSIGSVGGRSDNTVENIYIASSSISDSENGVRIKCNSGDTGTVKNVTYSRKSAQATAAMPLPS